MIERSFPFAPRSTRQLKRGDLIAVPCQPHGWACLQVVDLEREGPGSLKSFVAGAMPWFGEKPPSVRVLAGRAAVAQGLTRIELFTEGGLEVVGNTLVVDVGSASNFRDFAVGATHRVWGWRTAIRKAQEAAAAARQGP